MGRRLKQINLWVRRRSYLPLLMVGGIVVLLLYTNEETSISRNMEYAKEIRTLKKEIATTKDSTAYYQHKYDAIVSGQSDLEKLAREHYRMKKPTEDVYIVN